VEKGSGRFFVASVAALAGYHTQVRSLDQLMGRITEAIELYLEVQENDFVQLDFAGVQRVAL
jgi:predicted RNase H-like HicB family nuclease